MKLIILFLLFAPSLSMALINGRPLEGKPDLVRLTFTNKWVCTGTYIDDVTILTAGHCLIDQQGNLSQLETVQSQDDKVLAVSQVAVFVHPAFKSQSWPAYDLGIVKTSKNPQFAGEFKLAKNKSPFQGGATLFGCGKTDPRKNLKFRTEGQNKFLKVGSVLFFVGRHFTEEMNEAKEIKSTSVAPNDSGGPVIAQDSGEIIAVLTTTTAKVFEDNHLPILSTATSTTEKLNQEFILLHSN